jgi:predicted RNA-binding protein YlqC (UPF0109 family)
VQSLVDYMVRSVVKHPDSISLNVTEGDASVLYELDVHDDDRVRLSAGQEGNTLMDAMRQILASSDDNRRGVLKFVAGNAEE